MFKNKLAMISIILVVCLSIIGAAAFFLAKNLLTPDSSDPHEVKSVEVNSFTAEERKELTSELKEIKTNLADNKFIVLSFAFVLENEKTKAEFDLLLETRIKAIVINTLSDTASTDLQGSKGNDDISARLINIINKELSKGKLLHIDVTHKIITKL